MNMQKTRDSSGYVRRSRAKRKKNILIDISFKREAHTFKVSRYFGVRKTICYVQSNVYSHKMQEYLSRVIIGVYYVAPKILVMGRKDSPLIFPTRVLGGISMDFVGCFKGKLICM